MAKSSEPTSPRGLPVPESYPPPPPTHTSGMPSPGGPQETPATLHTKIAELEAKLAEKEEGRKTTRGLTPSIQALATIDTALRKLKGEDAAAVQRVVAWIAQEWLPPTVSTNAKPGG